MNTSEQDLETDFDVDAAGAQFDANRSQSGEAEGAGDPPDEGEASGEGDAPAKEANPHGHLSYEEWIEAGKDPDDYVGRNAYQQQHERIVDNRQLEKQVKQLTKTQQQTLDAIGDWQAQESARIRAELEAELHKAKEDEDVDGALEAQQALDEHDRKQQQKQQQQTPADDPFEGEPEVIANYRLVEPVLDPNSEHWDEEFNSEVAEYVNNRINAAAKTNRKVTDTMLERWLKKAVKDTHELFGTEPAAIEDEPPRGESPRNKRQGQQAPKRRQSQKPREAKAEDFKIENPRNPRQQNAAAEIRDLIATKYGDEDAKNFEKSLTR